MRVVPLGGAHARAGFRCGDAALDRYFKSQAGRDAARRLAAVFVLELADGRPGGFYVLAPATLFLPDLLGGAERKSSRYPPMPAARLSRLAVDARHRGQGHGRYLLADAMLRVARSAFESVALVAEAEDETAQDFYRHEGFVAFPDRPDRLFRTMAGVGK